MSVNGRVARLDEHGYYNVPVGQSHIDSAKRMYEQTRHLYTHDDFATARDFNGWVGYLGEIIFDLYLTHYKVPYTWHTGVHNGLPDFTLHAIGGPITVDVKSSYHYRLHGATQTYIKYRQRNARWSYFVMAPYEDDTRTLRFMGAITPAAFRAHGIEYHGGDMLPSGYACHAQAHLLGIDPAHLEPFNDWHRRVIMPHIVGCRPR